jgi:hypothetical protein
MVAKIRTVASSGEWLHWPFAVSCCVPTA